MSILVDTGAWYALADSADSHHAEARRFYAERLREDVFLTTDLVVAETWSLVASHLGRPAALTFWRRLRDVGVPVLTAEEPDLEAAWHIAQTFPDQPFSFVDCTTFAIMERQGILGAFAFDKHFLAYRFGPGRRRPLRRFPR